MNGPDPLREVGGEARRRATRYLRRYLRDHFDLDPGDLGVELLLERMAELLGPAFYNRGLEDARAATRQGLAALDGELARLRREASRR